MPAVKYWRLFTGVAGNQQDGEEKTDSVLYWEILREIVMMTRQDQAIPSPAQSPPGSVSEQVLEVSVFPARLKISAKMFFFFVFFKWLQHKKSPWNINELEAFTGEE